MAFEARELTKVFVVRNLGVLRKKNLPPAEYKGDPERVWNLNLPLFLQKEGWEIDVFQSNYRRGVKPGTAIKAGNKTLKFVKVIKNGNGTIPQANASTSTSANVNASESRADGAQERNDNKREATQANKLRNQTARDPNEGGAVFEYHDKENNITQRFVFNLRYYIGKNKQDGLYELAVERPQRSYAYGGLNLKRLQRRENTNSSEFVLIWEQQVKNETIRASARINVNKFDPFVKYDVEINEVPIKADKTGKDIVVDWYMLDSFHTGNKFWVDANGMQMIEKRLNYRQEYNYVSNNTVASNYYPVTSAIAIRDANRSQPHFNEKQVTILNDRSQGGSAGLRNGKNIELMQHRRGKKFDTYGVFEPVNDLDQWGTGVQIPASYYMLIEDKASPANQRAVQKRLDQPLLTFFSHDFRLNK